ncbi:MAG: PaaI family thioesterase [Odoribacter sp.]|nr:PaaI family thioesterase [Odoribacter sp.]
MRKELHNAYADLEGYNCFGCSPKNPYGLKCHFYYEDEQIHCEWEPSPNYQGFMNILHGGIQATLIDETASWAIFAHVKSAGVTTDMSVKYLKPVHTNKGKIHLRSRVLEFQKRTAKALVELFNADGELATQAEVTYMIYPEQIARRKLGWPGIEAFYK